jgi:hypothetical protein
MSMRLPFAMLLIVAVAGAGLLAGCGQAKQDQAAKGGGEKPAAKPKDNYNPHDVPITEEQKTELRRQTAQFADAVAKIKELRDETERETKNGIPENPYKAHQALDQADLVVQWLPEAARTSGVPKERWEEINTTANDLRTLFEKVHQNIDNKKDPDFAGVAPEIDRKIADLEGIAKAKAPPAAGQG